MYHLAKLGFSQSYTYFTWRNHRWDLTEYLKELTGTPVRHFFRPSFWPNTPDILHETLQHGGRPAFMMRAVLAATLTASWGIYGPAFELLEHEPRDEGSEEYLHSEKYQLRRWDLGRPESLRKVIARVNRIRRDHPALQRNRSLRFHPTDNEHLLCYSKRSRTPATGGPPGQTDDLVLMVVNLDPRHRQAGWTQLDLEALGIAPGEDFQVHDLLGGAWYRWHGPRNYVELDPGVTPAHIFQVIRHARSERDFEFFDL
jgi:starch synthase (maltosyl-transferring)